MGCMCVSTTCVPLGQDPRGKAENKLSCHRLGHHDGEGKGWHVNGCTGF